MSNGTDVRIHHDIHLMRACITSIDGLNYYNIVNIILKYIIAVSSIGMSHTKPMIYLDEENMHRDQNCTNNFRRFMSSVVCPRYGTIIDHWGEVNGLFFWYNLCRVRS